MSASATYRLPEQWAAPEVVQDRILIGDLAIHRAGISTTGPHGEELCGAAAACDPSVSMRAWFELLERVSAHEELARPRDVYELVDEGGCSMGVVGVAEIAPESDAPTRWRYARSNGVALHTDWTTACRRALWELAERDRVLRAWHGEIRPVRAHARFDSTPLGVLRDYAWSAYSFPDEDDSSFSSEIHVLGVFGFPRREGLPFVLGFAGRASEREAFDAAAAEALQLLAFLWGEPLPESLPTEPGPMQHLDTYQFAGAHRLVERWLEGEHLAYAVPRRRQSCTLGFVNLTPSWMPAGLHVVKAVCREATPLVFGESPFAAHLPRQLRIHPIP